MMEKSCIDVCLCFGNGKKSNGLGSTNQWPHQWAGSGWLLECELGHAHLLLLLLLQVGDFNAHGRRTRRTHAGAEGGNGALAACKQAKPQAKKKQPPVAAHIVAAAAKSTSEALHSFFLFLFLFFLFLFFLGGVVG